MKNLPIKSNYDLVKQQNLPSKSSGQYNSQKDFSPEAWIANNSNIKPLPISPKWIMGGAIAAGVLMFGLVGYTLLSSKKSPQYNPSNQIESHQEYSIQKKSRRSIRSYNINRF